MSFTIAGWRKSEVRISTNSIPRDREFANDSNVYATRAHAGMQCRSTDGRLCAIAVALAFRMRSSPSIDVSSRARIRMLEMLLKCMCLMLFD
jgi:hypothetical protein